MSSPKSLTSLSTFDTTLQCSCSFLIGLSRIENSSGVVRRLTLKKCLLAPQHKLSNTDLLINATFPEIVRSQHQLIALLFYQLKLICCKHFVFTAVEITPKQNTFCHPPGILSNSHLFASDVCNIVTANHRKRNTTLQQKMATRHIKQDSTK